jgi:hypothetical protein
MLASELITCSRAPYHGRGSYTPETCRADRPESGPQLAGADILVLEGLAIASRYAGESDVLDARLERDCHTRDIAFAFGEK